MRQLCSGVDGLTPSSRDVELIEDLNTYLLQPRVDPTVGLTVCKTVLRKIMIRSLMFNQ